MTACCSHHLTAEKAPKKQTRREALARSRQRQMVRLEKLMQPKVAKVLRGIYREVAARVADGMRPIPDDYRLRWARRLFEAQIKDGAVSAWIGWDVGSRILGTMAPGKTAKADDAFIGIGAEDAFLTSPTTEQVTEYFQRYAGSQAQTQAERINVIFERVKMSEYVNPETGERIMQGLNPGEIARELRREFVDMDAVYSRMIARTGVAYAHNAGAEGRYEEVGVTKKQWYATEDELTCEVCGELHETILPIGEDFESGVANLGSVAHPPIHNNCRCTILPVVELERN